MCLFRWWDSYYYMESALHLTFPYLFLYWIKVVQWSREPVCSLLFAAQPDFTTRPPGNPSLSGLGDNKQLIAVDGRDHEEGNGSFLAMQHKDTFFTYTLAQLCIVSFNWYSVHLYNPPKYVCNAAQVNRKVKQNILGLCFFFSWTLMRKIVFKKWTNCQGNNCVHFVVLTAINGLRKTNSKL